MKSGISGSRSWAEAAIAIVLLVVTVSFALSILDAQASFGEDRVSLMGLKEAWSATAGSYGIKGNVRTTSYDFVTQYRDFKEKPSIARLVRVDPAFAAAAARVDDALYRLEVAESLGGAGASANAANAALALDGALGAMADRIAGYSLERLKSARLSLAVLICLSVAIAGAFLFLERRIMVESMEVAGNRALAAALITAQEEERLRISHELHDAVAQDLAAARLYCDLLSGPGGGPMAEEGEEASVRTGDAKKASSLLERAMGEIREICQGLRPVELDRLGVSQACARLCGETASASGLDIAFSTNGFELIEGRELEVLGKDLEINVYRILQEALTNVRRHARATRVKVDLAFVPTALRIRIEDNGIGPGVTKPGMGRRGMEERARMLGGLLSVGPVPGGGTVVSATIPVPQRENA